MRTIAVSATVTLPAQPAVGAVEYIPLGGNGYTAPHAAYDVEISVTGAAGGGAADLRILLDPRFCSLVSYVFLQNVQDTAADAEFRVFIDGGGAPAQVDAGDITSVAATVSSASINRTWNPTPVVLFGPRAPIIGLSMTNVDSDVITLSTMIYLFNINARQATPMGPLLWARGAT